MKKDLTVRYSVTVKAPVEDVWNALTDPQLTKEYMFESEVDSQWVSGSPIEFRNIDGDLNVKGHIREIEPFQKLSYSVESEGENPDMCAAVTYTLHETDKGTVLNVSHGDFSIVENGEVKHKAASKSWPEVLEKLRQTVEAGGSRRMGATS